MTDNKDAFGKLRDLADKMARQQQEQNARIEPQNPKDYPLICANMMQYDFWTLKEGLNLLCKCHPKKKGWEYGIDSLWNIADRSIGASLKVANPEVTAITNAGRANKLKVRPSHLLEWATVKNITTPVELKNAISRNNILTDKSIDKANHKRADKKSMRLNAIEDFLAETKKRAEKKGDKWNNEYIKVTKEDLMDVFFPIYPNIDKVSIHTFKDDLSMLGARFKPGIKCNPDNDLTKLYEYELK